MSTGYSQESISNKADRLVSNNRVIITSRFEALVIGDHETYQVSKVADRWRCDCKWGRHNGYWRYCSHVVAVQRAMKDPNSQAPVARLADLLQQAAVGCH